MSEQSSSPSLKMIIEDSHGEGWDPVHLEIFGQRQHFGFAREEERYGSKMIRIDVPANGDPDCPIWETHWYGPAAIFGVRLTDAVTVFEANKRRREPGRMLLGKPVGHQHDDYYGNGDDE